ncbi:MAG: hypothetical protein K6F83_07035 [Clostridiales bacterium]|nr:hypothetical protein [Clostridiales bacterium]
MKKLLCFVLALSCFLGVYFTAPKSISSLGKTNVLAASAPRQEKEWVHYLVKEDVTFCYYTSSGSKRYITLKKGQIVKLYKGKYLVAYGDKGEMYQISVTQAIKDRKLVCIE